MHHGPLSLSLRCGVGGLVFCLLGLGAAGVWAQGEKDRTVEAVTAVQPDSLGEVTVEQLDSARKEVESDATLTDASKQKTLELYEQGSAWLNELASVRSQTAALDAQVKDAPQRIAEIQRLLGDAKGQVPDLSIPKGATLDDIEYQISEGEFELNRDMEALRKRQEDLSRLLVGGKGITEEIAARNKALEQIEKDLIAPAGDAPPVLARARELTLKARRSLRLAELEFYRKSLANQGLLTNLVQAERDKLADRIARDKPRLESFKNYAQGLREAKAAEARQRAETMRAQAAELPPFVRSIADENTEYRRELEDILKKDQEVSSQLQRSAQGVSEIKTDFERTRQRVEVVGPSLAIGKMLRQRRAGLPSLQSYRRKSSERASEISRATDRQLEIDERLRESGAVEAEVQAALDTVPKDLNSDQRRGLETNVQALIQERRDSLSELQKVYGRYVVGLTTLDLADRELVEIGEAFVGYIDDQLIWIPSTGLVTLLDADADSIWGLWLGRPDNWVRAYQDLSTLVRQRPLALLGLGLVVWVMLAARTRARERLHAIDQATRKIRTDSFGLSLAALWLAAVLALPAAVLMFGLGWLMQNLPSGRVFTHALGGGLINAGLLLGSLSLVRQLCRDGNLGDRHLHWPAATRKALLDVLRWFIPAGVPLAFLVAVNAGSEPPPIAQSAGGVAFIVLMLGTAYAVRALLGGNGSFKTELLDRRPMAWVSQLYFLWYPLAIGVPVALALTSVLGYHYTAVQLEQRLQMTLWFFFGALLVRDLILRWLFVAERRLRYEDALRRRDELRAQRAKEGGAGSEESAPAIPMDVPEINYDSLSEQSRRLVRAGFLFGAIIGTWSIWSELLPALGFLNNTVLPFEATRVVDGVARLVPVTLGDLAIGLFIVLITVLAAKNLPGILEISVLQRLPLEPGARYAITALSQYAIAGIGIVAAFSTLGLQWSNIQWLVAALSVGLGFGLQEIVANFVSGIIVLFERPIRVGDVVTIDTTTGVVARIRIRATTITNYDKQEFLVPNKEIITGRLTNWTLTDKMNRVVVTVGVAYGSDTRQAMALMLEAAAENENVLKDPKPVTSFEGFGDNALTLVLRTYLGSMENRLNTITALHQAINDKFMAAGIDIAFPQRDVHMETSKPLDIRLHRAPWGDARGGPSGDAADPA